MGRKWIINACSEIDATSVNSPKVENCKHKDGDSEPKWRNFSSQEKHCEQAGRRREQCTDKRIVCSNRCNKISQYFRELAAMHFLNALTDTINNCSSEQD